MKRSDISTEHVIRLALQWREGGPGVFEALVAEGIPPRLALSKIEQLNKKRLLECGVSESYSWPTDAGLALLGDDA